MKALSEPYGPIRFASCDDAAVPIGTVVDAEKVGDRWAFRWDRPTSYIEARTGRPIMSSAKDPNPMPDNPTKLPEPDAMGTNAPKPEPAEEHDDKGKPAAGKVGKDKDKDSNPHVSHDTTKPTPREGGHGGKK
jgi:hypothetical protein